MHFETPETVSRLFPGPGPGDSLETLSGFRARRARETPVRGGRGCKLTLYRRQFDWLRDSEVAHHNACVDMNLHHGDKYNTLIEVQERSSPCHRRSSVNRNRAALVREEQGTQTQFFSSVYLRVWVGVFHVKGRN